MPQDKITDLGYLKEVSSGDPEFMKEMVSIFFSQIPEFVENMEKFYEEKNYIDLGREAHKAKSSVIIVGMNDLGKRLKELQLLTETDKEVESYYSYIEEFKSSCYQAIDELNVFVETL